MILFVYHVYGLFSKTKLGLLFIASWAVHLPFLLRAGRYLRLAYLPWTSPGTPDPSFEVGSAQ